MAGCASSLPITLDAGCEWTNYIIYSLDDTQETQDQALANNLERKKHCNKEK